MIAVDPDQTHDLCSRQRPLLFLQAALTNAHELICPSYHRAGMQAPFHSCCMTQGVSGKVKERMQAASQGNGGGARPMLLFPEVSV